MSTNQIDSGEAFSGVAQTAAIGSSTSVSSGAAKIFREFKWGLLTLFILMTVVVCLVYDGGRGKKKKTDGAQAKSTGEGTQDFVDPSTPKLADNAGSTGMLSAPSAAPDHVAPRAEERAGIWDVDPNPGTPLRRPTSEATGSTGEIAPTHTSKRSAGRIPDPGNGDGVESHQIAGNGAAHSNRSLLQGAESPARGADSSGGGAFKIYTVKAGDNLSRIASANLPGKGGIKAIQDANKDTLPDANHLREGMKLKIPSSIASASAAESNGHASGNSARSENAKTAENSAEHRSAAGTKDDYIVQSGDTFERIARKVLNDAKKWKELQEWNKDRVSDSTKLRVGMVLRTHAPSGTPMAASTPAEAARSRRDTVRAEAEPVAPHSNDSQNLPNAEEVPLPIHPVAANSTSSIAHQAKAEGNKSKAGVKKEQDEEDAIKGPIVPEP